MCPSLHIDTVPEHESCTLAFDFMNQEDGPMRARAMAIAVKFVDRAGRRGAIAMNASPHSRPGIET